jgi:uncharacterized damage-inducible protein DinB
VTSLGIITATQDVLQQGLSLLSSVSEQAYRMRASQPLDASVGGHYRHVLDHFLCVLAGMDTSSINYDQRSRDPELENDRDFAERMTQVLIKRLRALTAQDLDRKCTVVYSVGYSSQAPEHIQTTFARELAFCVSHAVHHFAIIKLVCAHLSVPVQPELGVAPSTLRYRSAQAAS